MEGDDTDTAVPLPWVSGEFETPELVLHLVVAWFHAEPERVGQVAALDKACWLGRPGREMSKEREPLVSLVTQRPGESVTAPVLATTAISRRQLRLTPLGDGLVRVENHGKRALWINGTPMSEGVVGAGDTLMLENTAVLLLEERPRRLPQCAFYEAPTFAYGTRDPHGMVGESPAAWDLRDRLAAAAGMDAHVLLLGASGAGKEVAAAVLHGLSSRARGPMVARNAATMPGTLLDAELFGSAKNYPNTGAPERAGLIAAADGGHLMLDEIGELPEGHQAHLLRVLDSSGQYHRLGETRARASDFRLIAATNRDVSALKHDFLARFGQRVQVPSLEERRSDLPFLIQELAHRMWESSPELLARFVNDGDPGQLRLGPRLMEHLLRHTYVQQTRELQRLLQLAITTSSGDYLDLTPELLEALSEGQLAASPAPFSEAASPAPFSDAASPAPSSEADEVEQLRAALRAAGGNVTRAANRLGVSRHAMHRLIRRHGLSDDKVSG